MYLLLNINSFSNYTHSGAAPVLTDDPITLYIFISLFSENQAKDLLRNDVKAKNDTSGDILNNSGTMEYQQTSGQLSVNFKNMVCTFVPFYEM